MFELPSSENGTEQLQVRNTAAQHCERVIAPRSGLVNGNNLFDGVSVSKAIVVYGGVV